MCFPKIWVHAPIVHKKAYTLVKKHLVRTNCSQGSLFSRTKNSGRTHQYQSTPLHPAATVCLHKMLCRLKGQLSLKVWIVDESRESPEREFISSCSCCASSSSSSSGSSRKVSPGLAEAPGRPRRCSSARDAVCTCSVRGLTAASPPR